VTGELSFAQPAIRKAPKETKHAISVTNLTSIQRHAKSSPPKASNAKIRVGSDILQYAIAICRHAIQPQGFIPRVAAPVLVKEFMQTFFVISESHQLVPWAICIHPKDESDIAATRSGAYSTCPACLRIHISHIQQQREGCFGQTVHVVRINKNVHILEGLQRSVQFQYAVSQYPLSAFCFSLAKSSGEGWEKSDSRWSTWLRSRPLKTSSSGVLLRWSSTSRANMSSLPLLGVSESYGPVVLPCDISQLWCENMTCPYEHLSNTQKKGINPLQTCCFHQTYRNVLAA
jgi:hypothetical protein